jgi:xanthine dehydrogenase YagS FAD-binding subunit
MKYFEHFNAASVDEAIALLKRFNGTGKLNAGGTDLLGTLKGDILPAYPEAVINIKTIPGLDFIEEDRNGLKIGALTKLVDIVESPVIQKSFQVLADAAKSVASPEIRNMGTIGGNLCQESRCWYFRYPHTMGGRIHCFRKGGKSCPAVKGDNRYHSVFGGKKCFAVCPSDMAVALAAQDAIVTIAGPDGEKTLPLTALYHPLGCVLTGNELITEIQIPGTFRHAAQKFIKFRVRESVDFAIASVATTMTMTGETCRDVRIILGAVAPAPYRASAAEDALKGKRLTPDTVQAAAEAAVTHARPLSRNAYKVEIIKALVKRAINEIADSN